jgi:hypothetical protein
MVFPKKIAHLIIPLITIGFATIYYEENFDWVEEEFSQNLKNWLNRGKFFELQYSRAFTNCFISLKHFQTQMNYLQRFSSYTAFQHRRMTTQKFGTSF